MIWLQQWPQPVSGELWSWADVSEVPQIEAKGAWPLYSLRQPVIGYELPWEEQNLE